MLDDYDIPFVDMSPEEFLYRAMDEDDPMYIGPGVECDFDGKLAEWDDQLGCECDDLND